MSLIMLSKLLDLSLLPKYPETKINAGIWNRYMRSTVELIAGDMF